MKRWAIFTVFLYALALSLLAAPVVLLAFAWGKRDMHIDLHGLGQFYANWGFWLWLGVLVIGQALLLLLPINIAARRLPARRPLKIPVIVTAFFLANLCLAGLLSIFCAFFEEEGFQIFMYLAPGLTNPADPSSREIAASLTITVLAFWFIWAVVFRSFAKADAPEALLQRAIRWLLRGSILELLIAVPSHVVVRRRDDCCAPLGTFWGIATGISVMLLCFGPGVYFLFVKRMNRLQSKSMNAEKQN
jgi:hypothetical protein